MFAVLMALGFLLSVPVLAEEKNWQKEWDQTIAAARKEGKVVVVSGARGAEPRQGSTEPFEQKFGIVVEYITSGTPAAMAQRIKTERTAGMYLWDIFIGGTSTPITGLKPDGAIDPMEPALILPEVKDGRNWFGGQLEFADKGRTVLVILTYSKSPIFINSNLVKAEEFKSIRYLLDPRWKGKILSGDPRVAGPGQATFSFFYSHKDLGEDFLRQLARQEIRFVRDYRQAAEWLATGKYPILIGGADVDTEPFIKSKLPIQILDPTHLKEGGYLTAGPGGICLLNRAPHPNAAKVYLNWLLSKEGQTIFSKGVGYPSRRVDTPRPSEPWKFPPQKGYWVSYDESAVTEIKTKLVPLLKEIFGD